MPTDILKKPLAFTDVETMGNDEEIHEMIDVGLVLVDQETLQILDQWHSKIKPEHPETAFIASTLHPSGLLGDALFQYNGYNENDWRDAPSLAEVMPTYKEKTRNARLASWNAPFDFRFILKAFRKTGLIHELDYHCLEVCTLASEQLRHAKLEHMSTSHVIKFLGVPPEPMPHQGINGAMLAYEIYKRLRKR